jgi:hypothetical protein
MAFLYTTSEDAEAATGRIGILIAQVEKRTASKRRLLAKVQAAAEELRQREAAGKGRRPARKVEAV